MPFLTTFGRKRPSELLNSLCLLFPFMASTALSQQSPEASRVSDRIVTLASNDMPEYSAIQRGSNCDSLGTCKTTSNSKACQATNRWSVTADAMFLHRQTPDSVIQAFNTANPSETLNADQFHLGIHSGFDLSATRRFKNEIGIELRYFGFDHWNSDASVATTPGDLLQINSAVPIFTLAGDSINAGYQSTLHNAEFSLFRPATEKISLLGGFRYLELDEQETANLINPAIPFDYSTDTRNRFSGFQLGTKLNLWDQGGVFSLGGVGKAGIYGNHAAQNSNINVGVSTLSTAGRGTSTAFVGELGIIGKCILRDRLALRGGYNTLWLTDVALASDQLTDSDFANGTGFSNSGDLFYHGATAGLEYSW